MTLNIHVIECTIDPNIAPTHIGQHWVNTETCEMWFSCGTSSVDDWIQFTNDGYDGYDGYEADTDELVGVSSNDTTPGYLLDKLIAGTNISLIENNDGYNETLTISTNGEGLGEYKCIDYLGATSPSTASTAYKGIGNNTTLSTLSPTALIAEGSINEYATGDYTNIGSNDAYHVTISSSTDDDGEYSLFCFSCPNPPVAINGIVIETDSKIESDASGNAQIDNFDSITGWIASDAPHMTISLNTSIHQEGTGCMQVDCDGDADNDNVSKTYGSAIDLTNCPDLIYEERVDYAGSKLDYQIRIEDGSGNSKISALIEPASDDVWRTVSLAHSSFTEDQGPTTDIADIVKIYIIFGHNSGGLEIFYIDDLRCAPVIRRQEIAVWNDTNTVWDQLKIGESFPSSFEECKFCIGANPEELVNSSGDLYVRIRSFDPVDSSIDDLKIDYVRIYVDSRPVHCREDKDTCKINMSFGSDTKPYLKSNTTTYQTLAQFIFDGTDFISSPTVAKALFTQRDNGYTSDIKIFDTTNGNTIIEVTGLTPVSNQIFEIISLGTLSNLSTGEATWEIQLRSSDTKETWLGSLTIK